MFLFRKVVRENHSLATEDNLLGGDFLKFTRWLVQQLTFRYSQVKTEPGFRLGYRLAA